METVLIHHAEIGLKRRNFSFFENKLVQNIKKSFSKKDIRVTYIKREDKRIVLEVEGSKEKAKNILDKVFGIKNYSFTKEIEKDENLLKENSEELIKDLKNRGVNRISINVKRSDKNFRLNSLEIKSLVGQIAMEHGIKVDYKDYEENFYVEVTSKKIYLYDKKNDGLGGIPVGTSGKVLSLISGGIDSPLSSLLMMKRGCKVDFLHVHAFRNHEDVLKTKMKEVFEKLKEYQQETKVFFLPYYNYELKSQESKVFENYDLVLFKNYMLKIAEKIAEERGYDCIVTGDSLSQVASQTIENLEVTRSGIRKMIISPLITYDKQEIIDLSKKFGFFDISIKKYKDCCSIVSKSPKTKAKEDKMEREKERLGMEDLIEEDYKNIEEVDI